MMMMTQLFLVVDMTGAHNNNVVSLMRRIPLLRCSILETLLLILDTTTWLLLLLLLMMKSSLLLFLLVVPPVSIHNMNFDTRIRFD